MSLKKKIDHHDSREFWSNIICEDIKWFPFNSIMIHAANNIKVPYELSDYMLKILSIFNLRTLYNKITV